MERRKILTKFLKFLLLKDDVGIPIGTGIEIVVGLLSIQLSET